MATERCIHFSYRLVSKNVEFLIHIYIFYPKVQIFTYFTHKYTCLHIYEYLHFLQFFA